MRRTVLEQTREVNGEDLVPQIEKDRALETFKSLIQISVEGFKLLALLNGGAAVAILAYLGNIATKGHPSPDMVFPMGCYLVGLVLCGLAFLGSYRTQFVLFNEAMKRIPQGRHQAWVCATTVVVLLSLGAFAIGSFFAAMRLGS